MKSVTQIARALLSAGIATVVFCVLPSFAQPGNVQGHARYAIDSPRAMPIAIGDFDGDSRPDVATVQTGQASPSRTRYWILFQFSTGLKQSIGVTAPIGGLQIASRDVNGDNRPDLVLSTAWHNEPVAVLLNEGNGNFSLHDVNAFPASIWTSQASISSPDAKVTDASFVLPRFLSGESSQNQASLRARPIGERRIYDIRPSPQAYLLIRLLGRAPPKASSTFEISSL